VFDALNGARSRRLHAMERLPFDRHRLPSRDSQEPDRRGDDPQNHADADADAM